MEIGSLLTLRVARRSFDDNQLVASVSVCGPFLECNFETIENEFCNIFFDLMVSKIIALFSWQ